MVVEQPLMTTSEDSPLVCAGLYPHLTQGVGRRSRQLFHLVRHGLRSATKASIRIKRAVPAFPRPGGGQGQGEGARRPAVGIFDATRMMGGLLKRVRHPLKKAFNFTPSPRPSPPGARETQPACLAGFQEPRQSSAIPAMRAGRHKDPPVTSV